MYSEVSLHNFILRSSNNSVGRGKLLSIESKVSYIPTQVAWGPFSIPSASEVVDFVDGLKTIGGQGDPTLSEGVAVHMYMANSSMGNRAFCNNDGDMLILPQQRRLDIQTEHGR